MVAGLVFCSAGIEERSKMNTMTTLMINSLSGPKQEMEQHPYSTIGGGGAGGGGGAAMLDPNPF